MSDVDTTTRPALVQGVLVALLTPFDPAGAVDPQALTALVDQVVDQGADGVVALGTTGEFADLDDDERDLVTRTTVAAARGRVPVVVGLGGLSTDGAPQRRARRARRRRRGAGAPAAVLEARRRRAVRALRGRRRSHPLPVLLYDIPIFAGARLSPELVRRVAFELPQVVGIELTVQEFAAVSAVLAAVKPVRPEFSVTVGFEDLALSAVLAGGDGAISGMANFLAPTLVELVAAARRGDLATAAAAHREVMRLFPVYFQSNPPVLALTVLSAAHGVPVGPTVRSRHLTGAAAVERVSGWVATVAPVADRR